MTKCRHCGQEIVEISDGSWRSIGADPLPGLCHRSSADGAVRGHEPSPAPVETQASESELTIPEDLEELYAKAISGSAYIAEYEDNMCVESLTPLSEVIERIARLEQEVARLGDSHGKLLAAIIGYRSGRLTSREFFAAAEKLAAPSERDGGTK